MCGKMTLIFVWVRVLGGEGGGGGSGGGGRGMKEEKEGPFFNRN